MTVVDDRADRQLLADHAAGDPRAFEELFRRHRDRLWAVALRTLGNPDDAADALQDGMLSACRAAASFRGDSAVTTWLHRIVVNAALDLARRRASRPATPLEDHEPRDPRDDIAQRGVALAVTAALRQLPTEQAAAIVLVDIEGFPVRDVATMLDVPEGTVKSRCARGRAQLALLLADDFATTGNPAPSAGVPPPTTRVHPNEDDDEGGVR